MGSIFGPIRFLLPVCWFCWFLYTFNIHLYMHIFRRIFLSNYWWQESDIWSQASYRYAILWEAFLDPSDSFFLFADLVGFYTHWTYMHIFHHIFLSNYWWQRSDIWSQASYRYPISWEVFFDPSDSYFLFAKERGYHRWALAQFILFVFCWILFIFGILVGHDLSMHILYRFHGWLIFARVVALFMFVWPYVRSHICVRN